MALGPRRIKLRSCHPCGLQWHHGLDVVGKSLSFFQFGRRCSVDHCSEAPTGKVMQIFAGHAAGEWQLKVLSHLWSYEFNVWFAKIKAIRREWRSKHRWSFYGLIEFSVFQGCPVAAGGLEERQDGVFVLLRVVYWDHDKESLFFDRSLWPDLKTTASLCRCLGIKRSCSFSLPSCFQPRWNPRAGTPQHHIREAAEGFRSSSLHCTVCVQFLQRSPVVSRYEQVHESSIISICSHPESPIARALRMHNCHNGGCWRQDCLRLSECCFWLRLDVNARPIGCFPPSKRAFMCNFV